MTQFTIPLKAVPAQTLTVRLGDQDTKIDMRQTSTGIYVSVYISGVAIVLGRAALNLVKIVRRGMIGDVFFYDTQGASDPIYTGLGSRFILIYDDNG